MNRCECTQSNVCCGFPVVLTKRASSVEQYELVDKTSETCCRFSDNETGELWYVCLSLVAKTFLGWMLYANVMVMASESTCDLFGS